MAFEAGKMIRIKSSSTLVRRDPSTANPYIGRFYSGNMFLCAGTSGNWIKIRWGNRDKREYAYVPMNDAEELSVSTSYPLVPVLNMALSFAQNGGSLSGKKSKVAIWNLAANGVRRSFTGSAMRPVCTEVRTSPLSIKPFAANPRNSLRIRGVTMPRPVSSLSWVTGFITRRMVAQMQSAISAS